MRLSGAFGANRDEAKNGIGLALAGLVLVAVLPLLVVGAGVGWMIVDQKKATVANELAGTARALQVAVDHELVSQFTAMEVLAADVSLDTDNLDAFREKARRTIAANSKWLNLALIDPRTHYIIAGATPIPTPAPSTLSPAAVDQVVKTRKPLIAGVFVSGQITKKPVILFLSPVVRANEVRSVLAVVMNPQPLSEIFAEQRLAASWTGAVLDNHMMLAGRSRDAERYVGVPANPTLASRIAASEHGMFTVLNREGENVYTVFSRSPITGWSLSIGIPAAEVEGPIQRMLLQMTVAGGALITFALILSGMVGRGIVRRRKSYEYNLQQSRRLLAEVEKLSKLGGWKYDVATARITWTDEVYRIYGVETDFDQNDVKNDINFYAPEDREIISRAFDKAVRDGESYDLTARLVRRDGERRWVQTTGHPEFKNGKVVSVIGNIVDITERKLAEAALEESERRYRHLAEDMPLFIATFLPDGTLTYVNDALTKLVAMTRDQLTGMNFFQFLTADDQQMVKTRLASLTPQQPLETHEQLYSRPGEKDRCHKWTNRAFFDAAGKLTRFQAIGEDITDRKQAETALSTAKDEAEQASRAKSIFLANMSHEIRTPLNVVIGLGHLLRRDLADPVQQQRLDQLCEQSDHLLGLLNDILDMSKIDADRIVLDDRVFRLGAVADRVVRMLAWPARDKGLMLATDLSPELRDAALRGDPLRLAQILINLGSNAVKFTNKGTVHLKIVERTNDAASMTLYFAIEDTGIGIDPGDQSRLFHAFTQVDDSAARAYGGTGLGLAISQRLVMLMGGKIEVESEPGVGSRFSFELTLQRGAETPMLATQAATATHGLHVLFAEDHPLSQEILFEMLENLGCEVDVASNGVEAVECAQARRYDLILMDMQMPKMDGLAATRAIRALPGHRQTPIIAVTANAFSEDRRRCLDAGMNDLITKPVTPAMLAAALGQNLPLAAPAEPVPVMDDALSQALAAIPGLDGDCALRRTQAQLGEYRELLGRFIAAHSDDIAALRAHLVAGERDAAHAMAHNLKGISGLLGVRRMATIATELAQQLHSGADPEAMAPWLDAGAVEMRELAAAVRYLPKAGASAG